LSTHLHLGLPSGLFPSGFPTNAFLFSPIRATCPAQDYLLKEQLDASSNVSDLYSGVTGSYLNWDTAYPGLASSWFPSFVPSNCGHSVSNYYMSAFFQILSSFLFINHLTIQHYIVWVTDNSIK
jgi:hypothetical protein